MGQSGSEYTVVTAELHSAAEAVRGAVGPLSRTVVPSGALDATTAGHDQVGQTWSNLCTKLTEDLGALVAEALDHATALDASASSYDARDGSVASAWGSSFAPGPMRAR